MVRRGQSRRNVRSREANRVSPLSPGPKTESEIYDELLDEAKGSHSAAQDEQRPLKRRRVQPGSDGLYKEEEAASSDTSPQPTSRLQIIEESDSSEYEDSDSDIDFEDALAALEPQTAHAEPQRDEPSDISLVLNKDDTSKKPKSARGNRRLPATAAEKQKRLDIHKVHVCCLLAHCYQRNAWCNDETVQATLRPLLTSRVVSWLDPDRTLSQSGRSTNFVNGLQQAKDMWRVTFDIAETGLRRPVWNAPGTEGRIHAIEEETTRLTRKDFVRLAKVRKSSRDVGAQLFCALLRAVGVDARLVCSLQVLPFNVPSAPPPTPSPVKKTVYHSVSTSNSPQRRAGETQSSNEPLPIRRFGHTTNPREGRDMGVAPVTPVSKRRRIRDSTYPVFWVEAYNDALQKWVSVDPLVTQTIGKPARLEPPASDELNDLVYVIAFNDEHCATDVTRRYAKAYNAKTRRNRVESTKNGERWIRKTLKMYKQPFSTDQAQIESAELANKEAAEPMPRNVQDFKNHPYYALERHLRSHEIIHPKRQIGKIAVGKSGEVTEPIFRRRDVQQVMTADKWYRHGREIQTGEQPLKYHISKRGRGQASLSDDEDEEDQGVGLYAEFQTEPYVPPPVIRGKIPKNHFGNLDIYVPTMIPAGAAHVRAPEAAAAARLLSVDYADAVVGFQFKGRRGTAVTRGAIVARAHLEAVEEVVRGLRWQKEREANMRREAQMLRLWKRFLIGLRIRDRIEREHGTGTNKEVQEEIDDEEYLEDERAVQGGFVQDTNLKNTVSRKGKRNSSPLIDRDTAGDADNINDLDRPVGQAGLSDYLEPSILSPWDEQNKQDEQQMPDAEDELFNEPNEPGGFMPQDEGGGGGGGGGVVIPEDENQDEGGGFIREGEDEDEEASLEEGGFEREEAPSSATTDQKAKEEVEPMQLDGTTGEEQVSNVEIGQEASGGGFMVEDEPSPALETLKTDINVDDTLASKVDNNDSVGDIQGRSEGDTVKAEATSNEQEETTKEEEVADDELASQSDTSMLSHDPDDDDAEPEWLADV